MSNYSLQLETWKKRREIIYKEHYGKPKMSLGELAKKYNISVPQVCSLLKKHKNEKSAR